MYECEKLTGKSYKYSHTHSHRMIIHRRSALIGLFAPFANVSLLNYRYNGGINDPYAQLSKDVRSDVREAIQSDPTMAGSILRLAFHDAAVYDGRVLKGKGGSDGSIMYEMDWSENRGLERKSLKFINELVSKQNSGENKGGKLSIADTIALAGAEAVEVAGGPHIAIRMGRQDTYEPSSRTLLRPIKGETERSDIVTTLPSPGLDSLGLRIYFKRLGLDEKEFIALMGSHDLGRHVTLTGMQKSCLRNLTRQCLEEAPISVPFVSKSPDDFSNLYFQKLINWYDRNIEFGEASFIPTDVALVVDDGLRQTVQVFANDQDLFFETFARAYQRIVDRTAASEKRY